MAVLLQFFKYPISHLQFSSKSKFEYAFARADRIFCIQV